jgi:6-phosphogluconolactonase (cycloisomerase 2 family)
VNSAPEDGVSAFAVAVSPTGQSLALTLAGTNVTNSSAGFGIVHLQPSPSGKTLVIAGYGSGTVAAVRIDPATGHFVAQSTPFVAQHTGSSQCTTAPAAGRQTAPHPHSVARFEETYYAVDLGLDKVFQYAVDDTTAALRLVDVLDVQTCSGPRHMVFHPSGTYAYLLHEMGSVVSVHPRNLATGKLAPAVHTYSTVPPGWAYCATVPIDGAGNCTKAAEIRVTAAGTLIFASNRGHNSIAAFRISRDGAELEPLGWPATGLVWPRGLELTPDSSVLVAASNSQPGIGAPPLRSTADDWDGSVVAFAINTVLTNGGGDGADGDAPLLHEIARLDVPHPCDVQIQPVPPATPPASFSQQ